MHTVWEPAIPFKDGSLKDTNLIAAHLIKAWPCHVCPSEEPHRCGATCIFCATLSEYRSLTRQLTNIQNKTKGHIFNLVYLSEIILKKVVLCDKIHIKKLSASEKASQQKAPSVVAKSQKATLGPLNITK